MNREEVFKTLNTVFQTVFDDEDIIINEDTNSDDIEDWDSLEHINLLVTIEKEFKIKFNMNEVTNMKNVGEMVDIILSKIK